MAKKRVNSKKGSTSKSKKGSNKKPVSKSKTEKILIENFTELQKVMTNFSERFDNLSNQISKLLELFETSAKSFMENEGSFGEDKKENQKIVERLNNLIEQNKIIARGLTLLHEARENHSPLKPPVHPTPQNNLKQIGPPQQSPAPKVQQPSKNPPTPSSEKEGQGQTKEENSRSGQYQKSISNKSQ